MKKPSGDQVRGEGRTRILSAALDLFADHGFDAVSTTHIAKAAKSAQSVVLYHFKTKDILWREAMTLLFSRVSAQPLVEREVYKDLSAIDRMKVLLRSFVAMSAHHPQLGRVIFREGLNGGERLDWLLGELASEQYTVFKEAIDEVQDEQSLKRWNPAMLMLMIHAAGATLFNLEHLSRHLMIEEPFAKEVVSEQADMLVAAFVDGLISNASSRSS